MKKPVKIALIIAAFLVIAGLFAGETIFVLSVNKKNEGLNTKVSELNTKIDELQDELDSARDDIKELQKEDGDALSEEGLVKLIKEALADYIDVAGDKFEDVKTLKEFFDVLFSMKWADEIHEIWDDTQVVEAYRSGNAEGLSEEDRYVLETASGIIDDIISEDMTDYEKELAVYNWQVKYVQYDEKHFAPIPSDDVENYNYYPYGVLKYHSAICVGNATTFKLFMDMLDIDCRIIHSTVEGEHAWNLVCIDGDWYHVDVTFDGGIGEPTYAYFNVPDSFKLYGGYPWDTTEFPAADGYKYCYCYNNAVEVNSADEIPQLIKDKLDGGGGNLYIKSGTYLDGVYDIVEEISARVDDSVWLYLEQDGVEVGDCYIYVVSIENDLFPDDGGEGEEDGGYEDGGEEDPIVDSIIDKLF